MDGYISPCEMAGLVRLFLPAKLHQDEDYVRELIQRMDRNGDGMIAYEEFVQTVRETGEPDFLRSADILRTELVCKYVLTGTATH